MAELANCSRCNAVFVKSDASQTSMNQLFNQLKAEMKQVKKQKNQVGPIQNLLKMYRQ